MKKILKKFVRLILGDAPPENEVAYSSNLKQGKNCSIDKSAILNCSGNSKIELEGENYIGRNVEIGPLEKIYLGYNTSIQDRCILLGDIEIGRHCLFAPNIYISSGRHYYDLKPEYYIKDQDSLVRNDAELSKKHSRKVVIEDDCWLGVNVVVMSGVTIGKGSVIGANSVVTKNIEPYSVMAGVPAAFLKKRLEFELKSHLEFSNDLDFANQSR